MKPYLDLLKIVLEEGELVQNRTGISAYTYPHMMIRHNMSEGFPLLTTKKMAWKSIKVELEFFIKGLTDKKWLQERGCHIWDEWCNPAKIPQGLSDEDRKKFQFEETDLGSIYGAQWRNYNSQGVDQLRRVVDGLKNDLTDRRLVCSAWNPCELEEMALPPCHVIWHAFVVNRSLHLCWWQRSVDCGAGLPFNLASYALLLHLLCKETGLTEGILTGFLSNVHIYENHVDLLRSQILRQPFNLPVLLTRNFTSIFDWEHSDTEIVDYRSHPSIKLDIAV